MKKRIISILTTVAIIATMLTTLVVPASALDTQSVPAVDTTSATTSLSNIIDLNDSVVYGDVNAKTGFIFYPGGDVSYKDYAPLLMAIAQKGYLVISVRMPLNYAILNIPAATIFTARYKNVENWYIGGHSLGGAMASVYAGFHAKQLDGLVLFAAYSTMDLSKKGLSVLEMYGSNDGVLNMENYAKYQSNLPSDTVELVIEGGNHGQFGDYGFQDGDNEATISATEQVEIAANAVGAFFAK